MVRCNHMFCGLVESCEMFALGQSGKKTHTYFESILKNSAHSKEFVSRVDVAGDLVGETETVLTSHCSTNSSTNPIRHPPPHPAAPSQVLLWRQHDQLGRMAISQDPSLASQSSQHDSSSLPPVLLSLFPVVTQGSLALLQPLLLSPPYPSPHLARLLRMLQVPGCLLIRK